MTSATCPPIMPSVPIAPGQHMDKTAVTRTGHQIEREGIQGITGQHRDIFSVCPVQGRFPPAEIVIVHAGQIVMNERIGVDKFDACRDRQNPCRGTAEYIARCNAQRRPEAFSPGEHTISDRLVNDFGFNRFRQEVLVEILVYLFLPAPPGIR